MFKRTLPIALVLTFVSGVAVAANNDTNTYKAMDANGDNQISEEEFYNYYDDADVFGIWDANQDGMIDENEFVDGLYGYYDDNDDGYINDAEWEDGLMEDDYGDEGFWDV